MVAGHSLGEYAALMVSGILGMDGALRAAAARGTEMGSVVIEDTGLMASITADYKIIKDVLSTIDGYVIAANKNSPRMTVIAGDSPSVKEAIRRFEGLDITAVILPTSHAFHSTIVEPAAEPLRKFLDSLEINLPEIPITSNVDGTFYPMNRDENRTPKEQILDKLAPQMSSPVEWTKQIETMYKAGVRVFVEVGPKRALTMFTGQILEGKPNLSVMTNHPKFGGIASIMNALATMAIAGRPYRWPRSDSLVLTEAFRAGPLEVWESVVVEPKEAEEEKPVIESLVAPEEIIEAAVEKVVVEEEPVDPAYWLATILSAASGYPAKFCYGQVNLKTGLGMNDEVIESVLKSISKQVEVDSSKDSSSFKTANEIIEWVQEVPDSFSIPLKSTKSTVVEIQSRVVEKIVQVAPKDHRKSNPYVVTGVSLGLPGDRKVFDEDNFEKLVRGETCIREVPDDYKQKILDKKIVRLIKGRDGQARMETAQNFEDIPQLAGIAGDFDITEEFGISEKVAKSWDITTQLATAAGLLALRDAGIPLTPVEKIGKGGLRLITNWKVPSVYRDNTGIIFASCFPGSANTTRHSMNNGDDGEGSFDRSYLFQTLNMGHSQFAQFTGIRGPNSTINLACASTAAAFTVAEDWLETGRCERVVVISSDDVTGPDLWEWIGAGFAASGAASTSSSVEDAALPFDQRRNGLILGMGAAAFVIEKKEGAAKRGVQPYAELLGAHIGNSAFHGTRLDVENVASQVDGFVSRMEKRWGIERKVIAPNTVFFSHETYTPARGGSAQAEVKALRDTFGEDTDSLLISNTKGFTGHPMGVGIEDASMIHALATGRIPPIANHKVFDPELGNLNLSKGGYHENINYGLRFAAGFGSQIAITLWKSSAVDGERIDVPKLLQWNRKLAGTEDLILKVLKNKLVAYVDGENNLHGGMQGEEWLIEDEKPEVVESIPEPTPEPEKESEMAPVHTSMDISVIQSAVVQIVVEHTGYPEDFIELDQDLEGELGIDTVKQAEMMGDIRDKFSLPIDDIFSLAEHPTLNHFVNYIVKMTSGVENPSESESEPELVPEPAPEPAPEPEPELVPEPAPEPKPASETAQIQTSMDLSEIQSAVIQIVVDHTGYPEDFIELDQDLEGELGIDTVKQAEMMGDIRENFSLPLDESFSLAEHPTLNHFVDYIVRMTGGVQAVEEEVTPAVEETPWRWSDNVVNMVLAEYHLDDRDELIETAKLHDDGNRYLKREEIQAAAEELKNVKSTWRYSDNVVEEVLQEFGLQDASALIEASKVHDDGNLYLKRKELQLGAGDLKGDERPLVNPVAPEEKSQVSAVQTTPREGVRRWQVEVEEAIPEADLLIPSGTILVSDDGIGISEEICRLLEEKGLNPIRLSFELDRKEFVSEEHAGRFVLRVDPSSEEQLDEMSNTLSEINGIIHLAPVQLAAEAWGEKQSSRLGSIANHSLFHLLKRFDADFATSPNAFVASLSAMDGRHGNIGERFNSLACGASGIVKSYSHERQSVRCRAWDIHPELATDSTLLAQKLLDDLFNNRGEVEIGFDKDERRWCLVMFDEELNSERVPLVADDVWLVSGGGSGVTAASIIGVANASKNSGAMFVLLGRTEAMEEPATWLDWSEEKLADRKLQLREELISKSDGEKISIVEWNKAWQPYLRSRDIHQTIATIRRTGNKAIYRACDVCDVKGLRKIAQNQGPITGIVHGAGIEDSKLVADKEWRTFDMVLKIKVDGWKALYSAANSSGSKLRFAAAFTSVAGRFGNGGQTDYAAANSILDAEMARLTAAPNSIRAVATAWTGWKDVGMATRGSLEKIFEGAGIDTIPVDTGINIFVDEALCGGKRRVLCCGAMGVMDNFDSFRAPPLKLSAAMTALIADPSRFPFVDRLLQIEDNESLLSECTLSTKSHPFLVDHAIDGVPYHPGVMAMEMFAENALLLNPEYCLAGFEDVKFGLPIKLLKGEITVRTVAEVSRRKRDHIWVSCRLESDLKNSRGEIFGKPRVHHSGLVRLVLKSNDLTKHLAAELHDIPEIGIPAKGELAHHPSFIYLRFFHGPRFQSHGGIIRGIGDADSRGADGIALMRHQLPAKDQFECEVIGETVLLESLPMLIEAGFQNAGLVTMEADGLMSLPVGIEWMTILAVPDEGENLRLRSIRTALEEGGVTKHDVLVIGEDDSPVLALKGLRLKAMAPLADEMRFSFEE
jgi:3-oxoacyl-(acyl-carrier-protein) synthase/acyl carrier protein